MSAPTFFLRRAASLATVALAVIGLAGACARVIASSPPPRPSSFGREAMVSGVPIVVAARGARTLQGFSFSIKRFSSDSLWGSRTSDSINVRMRFAQPVSDSTRVFIELWMRCDDGTDRCMRGLHELLVLGMSTDDPPPQ